MRVTFFAYGIRKGLKPDFNIIEKEPAEGGADCILPPGGELSSTHTYNNGKALTEVNQVESGEVVYLRLGGFVTSMTAPIGRNFVSSLTPNLNDTRITTIITTQARASVLRIYRSQQYPRMKGWEIIADNLSKAGWSWGCVSAIDSNGRTIFVSDAQLAR